MSKSVSESMRISTCIHHATLGEFVCIVPVGSSGVQSFIHSIQTLPRHTNALIGVLICS